MFLDPTKLVVVLVIALMVLGPEELPRFARKIGALRAQLSTLSHRLDEEARARIPDIPDVRSLGGVIRSPASALERLASLSEHESLTIAPVIAEPLRETVDTNLSDPFATWPTTQSAFANGRSPNVEDSSPITTID